MVKNKTEIHQPVQLLWNLKEYSYKNILPDAQDYDSPTIPGMQQSIVDVLP